MLKRPSRRGVDESAQLSRIARVNRPLYRAHLLKESFLDFFDAENRDEAKERIQEWRSWASRSRLAPFVKLARTVKAHHASGWALAQRILPPLPTAFFLAAAVLMQILHCEVAYLRAHKREPIVVLNVASSLATGSLVWLLGRPFGPLGAAAGYLAVIAASTVCGTFIWWRCREKWHHAMTP